jgi:hypothetical protein
MAATPCVNQDKYTSKYIFGNGFVKSVGMTSPTLLLRLPSAAVIREFFDNRIPARLPAE